MGPVLHAAVPYRPTVLSGDGLVGHADVVVPLLSLEVLVGVGRAPPPTSEAALGETLVHLGNWGIESYLFLSSYKSVWDADERDDHHQSPSRDRRERVSYVRVPHHQLHLPCGEGPQWHAHWLFCPVPC